MKQKVFETFFFFYIERTSGYSMYKNILETYLILNKKIDHRISFENRIKCIV